MKPVLSQAVPGQHQQGSVLVISLLILLIMSLLSITSVNNSVLEEKMAANSRNSQIVFQAAEGALRAAELDVSSKMTADTHNVDGAVDTGCSNGLCDCDNRDTSIGGSGLSVNGCTAEFWTDSGLNVWNDAAKHKTYTRIPGNPAKYIIEYMGKTQPTVPVADPRLCATCPDIYRITALGENANSGARVMLQSTFRK